MTDKVEICKICKDIVISYGGDVVINGLVFTYEKDKLHVLKEYIAIVKITGTTYVCKDCAKQIARILIDY